MPHQHFKTKQAEHEETDTKQGESEGEAGLIQQTQVTELEEKVAATLDRLMRVQADMENVRRRAQRDVENAHKFALEKFLTDLLPIVDGLERALFAHAGEDSTSGSLLDGVGLTLRMLYATFDRFGIRQVDPRGAVFNPEHHQAVSTSPATPGTAPGTVVEVLQKGYLLNDRLVRPALVVVAGNGN